MLEIYTESPNVWETFETSPFMFSGVEHIIAEDLCSGVYIAATSLRPGILEIKVFVDDDLNFETEVASGEECEDAINRAIEDYGSFADLVNNTILAGFEKEDAKEDGVDEYDDCFIELCRKISKLSGAVITHDIAMDIKEQTLLHLFHKYKIDCFD